jgi:hypothetical protein
MAAAPRTPPARLLASRRGFLQLAGASAALTALGQLRVLPSMAATGGARVLPAVAAGGARFFDERETEILTQIVERMVETGDPAAPALRDTAAVATIDAACGQLDPAVSGELPLALRLFEYGPILFDLTFSRFTRMSDAEKDASIEAWSTSRFAVRRMAFLAFRNLAMLGYYSQPETWELVGYRGPLLGSEPAP